MSDARGAQLARALEGHPRPCALVDLDAFDANLTTLITPVPRLRVASKSVRVPALLERVLRHPKAFGVLTYHTTETQQLAALGFDDFLLAYPPSSDDVPALVELSASHLLHVTVDGTEAIDALSRAAVERGTTVRLCLDLDLSLQVGPLHFGVRRSPLRSAAQVLELAQYIEGRPGVELTALLAYEAQVAGVRDHSGGLVDLPVRLIKRRSRRLVLERRAAVVEALGSVASLQVINGGGTGSVHFTGDDPSITEVSAGSGLYCPHLFDGYAGLQLIPAAFFALAVVRRSDPGFFTCYGGGYVASGSAGRDRLPQPWWPAGLKTVDLEGFGEVQTPFQGELPWGATVLCRHAKAGELMEHFERVHLIDGDRIVATVPTYRGLPTGS